VFVLAGKTRPDVANSLVAWKYSEAAGRLEVVLRNQAEDRSFLYSEDRAILPGSKLSLSFASGDKKKAFFAGAIESVAARFALEPTITLVALGKRTGPFAPSTVRAAYGADLIQFNPILEDRVITGGGVTELNLDVRPGTTVEVSRVGRVFSRKYAVETAVHEVDADGGRTTFVASARR
jgi:hypothetical protein